MEQGPDQYGRCCGTQVANGTSCVLALVSGGLENQRLRKLNDFLNPNAFPQ